jgi:patatin-like phospholipase/acyl hydrolase
MNKQVFKILTIDGGGIRGIFPAHILCCVEQRLGINATEQFNMIAGTSTGAIVAAAIACGINPTKIISLYRECCEAIFSRKNFWGPKKYEPAFHSLYENAPLSAALEKVFGDLKLGDISIPLLLPATDIGNGGVHVFKSSYSADFTRDKDVMLRLAVLASCSAPTYFNPTKVNEYLLADGGLWANNPSLAAAIDAHRRLNVDLANIRILSLGTGHAKTCYDVKFDRKWGLLNGWKGPEFISFLMSLQAQSTHNYLQLMMGEEQLCRLNFESDRPLPLDDYSAIEDLISNADRVFTYNSSKLKEFFNLY